MDAAERLMRQAAGWGWVARYNNLPVPEPRIELVDGQPRVVITPGPLQSAVHEELRQMWRENPERHTSRPPTQPGT